MAARAVEFQKFKAEESHIEWLVDSLLPNTGWSILVGARGIGKTTFTLQMCAALSTGMPFLGLATKSTKILYCQADSPEVEWRGIVQRVIPENALGWTAVNLPDKCLRDTKTVSWLQEVTTRINPGLVVFDCLYNLAGNNLNTDAILLDVRKMHDICDGRPFVLLHHPPHNESRASGHNSIEGNASNVWTLLKNKLVIRKARLAPAKDFALRKDKNGLWHSANSKDTESDISPELDAMLKIALNIKD